MIRWFSLWREGLDRRSERLSLLGCVLLAAMQLCWLATAQLAGDPINDSFARRLLAFNEARLRAGPLAPGQVIDLSRARSDDAPVALLSGWSAPEANGVWTVAPEAVLLVAPPPPGSTGWRVVVTIEANLDVNGRADIGLAADGRVLLHRETTTSAATLVVTIPSVERSSDRLLHLGFLSRPHPASAGSKDPRALGVSVKTVTFEPI